MLAQPVCCLPTGTSTCPTSPPPPRGGAAPAQALADAAALRSYIAGVYGMNDAANKWVAFGGSYSGALLPSRV